MGYLRRSIGSRNTGSIKTNMIMRKFIYILVSIIISYMLCVYEYNAWDFIVGLEPSHVCVILVKLAFYSLSCYWIIVALLISKN